MTTFFDVYQISQCHFEGVLLYALLRDVRSIICMVSPIAWVSRLPHCCKPQGPVKVVVGACTETRKRALRNAWFYFAISCKPIQPWYIST